ncbi:hypothetical protein COU17_03345 [Candidatus Kaiserbacteria bacterium CG10_big_fil_rev_8_21_14_0_10_49_17]|uniref:SpoVT-AbrB domain-containing protein n=1 Tax=Candidatus Kaiserbacteria bacterium CG10_big_fil_rev_8_21_14_0_10_49_17 TaxID=1974609 RepID=A0A2M6WDS9_9BACT|nr:MAG: hypothetical protein COU17_03345 [Candidatus Kaiserbacteria bacterium CG10_big_fil_rev_8_21_14_0_10_49_17]
MARRKINERNIRKLGKGATSYYVTVPIEVVRDLDWQKGQKLVVEVDARHKELIIRDWEK